MNRSPARRRARGGTLIVALVMLMLMMIHALASFTAADAQLRNTGAQQARQEAQAAAQLAIAGVLGSAAFVAAPPGTPAASMDVDVDGDGVRDYRVTLAVSCSAARMVASIVVPPSSPDDAACLSAATPSGEIPCADTTWDIEAVARPASAAQTGTTVAMHQGVNVRLESSEAIRSCPGLRPGTAVAATPLSLGKARRKTYWYIKPGV